MAAELQVVFASQAAQSLISGSLCQQAGFLWGTLRPDSINFATTS